MSFAFAPDYNAHHVDSMGDRAIVIGAGIAGLLAARVLADSFEEVYIIERDELESTRSSRAGVPQSPHPHIIHPPAQAAINQLFPNFSENLDSAGAVQIDAMSDLQIYDAGGYLASGSPSTPMYCASRGLFEQQLRKCVLDQPSIECWERCHVVDYQLDQQSHVVEGVVIRQETDSESVLTGDLVIDATGRGSRTREWLSDHDFPSPETTDVEVNLAYSTTVIDRPADDTRTLWAPSSPPRTRGGGMIPIENNQWQILLQGIHGDHPPTTGPEYKRFAASLPVSPIESVLREKDLRENDINYYPFVSNRRIFYEQVNRFPERLLVIGDAIASFNPIYGQGIVVAALESLLLHQLLSEKDLTNIGPRFFAKIKPVVKTAWMIATARDLQYPNASRENDWSTDLLHWYLRRVMRSAHVNGKVRQALLRVLMFEERPTKLFKPRLIWQVFTSKDDL